MIKYFKFFQKATHKAVEPINQETWIKHGFSEFIGTIALSLLFAGLSIVVLDDNGKAVALEYFFVHPLLVGFYAGFIGIGLLLVIFLRWSCDLNPAVTIVRILNGTNSVRYGFFKIAIQFAGAICAGLIIYGFGNLHSSSGPLVANHAIDAVKASHKQFISAGQGNIAVGAGWIFLVEIIATAILLFPIFSQRINEKSRDILIMLMVSLAVFVGMLAGSAALNPARGLAQQVPALFFGTQTGDATSRNSLLLATVAMLAGTFLSPFFYLLVHDFADKLVFYMRRATSFKNYRNDNMKIN